MRKRTRHIFAFLCAVILGITSMLGGNGGYLVKATDNAGESVTPVSLEGFQDITVADFESSDGATMESKQYTENATFTLKEWDDFDKKLLSLNVTFENTGWSPHIEFCGIDDSAFFYVCPQSASRFVLEQGPASGAMTSEAVFTSIPVAGTGRVSSINEEYLLQISIEYKDYNEDNEKDGVQLGFYLDGTPVVTKDVKNCDMNKLGNRLTIRCDGYPVTVKTIEEEAEEEGGDDETETPSCYFENYKQVTTSSFVASDGTSMPDSKRYENNQTYNMQNVQGNVIENFDNTIFSMKVKFESTGEHARIQVAGKTAGNAFMIYPSSAEKLVFTQMIWSPDTSRMAISDPYTTFSAGTAGVTSFVDNEFILQISLEYGNYDSDSLEDDVKIGFYFGGTLYNGAYKIITDCNLDTNFGNCLTVYCDQTNGGAPVTVSSFVPTNPNLMKLTWSDFHKAGTNKAAVDQIVPIMENANDIDVYTLSNSDISNMQNTAYESQLMFEKAESSNRIYYAGTSDWKGMILHARSDGNLWLQSWDGVSPDLDVNETLGVIIFDKDISGVGTFLNNEFKLKITTEFASYDGGEDANDVQLGFYFNDKLYNNQYLYAYDCKDDFGNYISLHPGTGCMSVRSTTDAYEEVIQHVWDEGAYEFVETEEEILVNGVKIDESSLTIPGDYMVTVGETSIEKVVLYSEYDPHPDDRLDIRDLVATVKVCGGVPLDSWAGNLAVCEAGMDAEPMRERLLNLMEAEESNAVSMDIIGGKDVMPLAGYSGPHRAYQDEGRGLTEWYPDFISDKYYKYLSEAGINLITYTDENYVASNNEIQEMLELGETYGIGHFVTDSNIIKRIGTNECTNIVIQDGVATIKDAATLRAADSTDLDITGEMTIFMKVKVDSLPTNTTLVSKGPIISKAYSLGISNYSNLGWWFSSEGYKYSYQKFPTAEWRELAVVVTYDGNGMNLTYYLAKDSDTGITEDCNITSDTVTGTTGLTNNYHSFYIGNYTINGISSTTSTREYDDIRIYNQALTVQQLASITPNQTDEEEEVINALVAHWDFENDGTEGSELKDKATSGAKADDLSIFDADGTLYQQSDLTSATLQERIANYSNYDSFCGMFLVDEPTTDYYMAGSGMKNISNYKTLANVLQNDLGFTCFSNMYPVWGLKTNQENYEKYVEEYCKTLQPKILSWDNYPFEKGHEGKDVYFYNMSLMREKAQKYQIPFWATIQAGGQWGSGSTNGFETTTPTWPTEEQFNWNINTCLAFGVQGIDYFPLIQPIHFSYALDGTYDYSRNGIIGADGRLNEWYYYAQKINTHIKAIDKVLMNAVNKGIIVSGDGATADTSLTENCVIESGIFRELQSVRGDAMVGCFNYNGKTALYVVNYSMDTEQSITLTLDKAHHVKVVKGAKATFENKQELQLDMTAGEGILLVIE